MKLTILKEEIIDVELKDAKYVTMNERIFWKFTTDGRVVYFAKKVASYSSFMLEERQFLEADVNAFNLEGVYTKEITEQEFYKILNLEIKKINQCSL